jgi:hypothetical protein
MEANDLHSRIQANLQQLSTLESKPHHVKDGPVITSMHYYFDEEEVGKIDLLKSCLIILRSELVSAVFHKPPLPPPLQQPSSPVSDSAVASDRQPSIVVYSEGEDVPHSKK